MNSDNEKFIVEELSDMSINKKECSLSAKIYDICLQYIGDNIILDNGQMICLNYTDDIKEKIFDYLQKILIEFIKNENRINKCYDIKKEYFLHINNHNNTNSYVSDTCEIIVGMDKTNKYIWCISKLLVDNIEKYEDYILWQKSVTNIDEKIRNDWKLIYDIRCKIEHPENLRTTMFERTREGIVIPKIIYKEKEYNLLKLAEESLYCVYMFLK